MAWYSRGMDAPEDGQLQPDSATLPPHTPGAGDALLRKMWGPERAPQITPEDERATAELLARARQMITPRGERAA